MAPYLHRILFPPMQKTTATTKPLTPLSSEFAFNPDNIVIASGCNAALENTIFCLTETEDNILTPAPMYATFPFDLSSRIGVKVNIVELESKGRKLTTEEFTNPRTYYPTSDSLNLAYESCGDKKPKVLLLTNPINPLGINYPKETLEMMYNWAEGKDMHVVR